MSENLAKAEITERVATIDSKIVGKRNYAENLRVEATEIDELVERLIRLRDDYQALLG